MGIHGFCDPMVDISVLEFIYYMSIYDLVLDICFFFFFNLPNSTNIINTFAPIWQLAITFMYIHTGINYSDYNRRYVVCHTQAHLNQKTSQSQKRNTQFHASPRQGSLVNPHIPFTGIIE